MAQDVENMRFLRSGAHPKIYFIGIGGVSMSSLAILAGYLGACVVGSDIGRSENTERLTALGIKVYFEHASENIEREQPCAVVYSMSIDKENSELLYAFANNIPVYRRGELMGLLLNEYDFQIAVSGSHGKSTVTAMLAESLSAAGANPTVLSGAKTKGGSPLIIGDTRYAVYEACEYKNSFLSLFPGVAVLLNADLDHTDFFRSHEDILNSFLLFANRARSFVVLNADDRGLMDIADRIYPPKITVGKGDGADFKYERIRGKFGYELKLYYKGRLIYHISPKIIGEHNFFNLAVTLSVMYMLGAEHKAVGSALSDFSGIERRLQRIATHNGAHVYYDYAHHPREIGATIDTLYDEGYKKIAVVFSPHTYSRTEAFLKDFATELSRVYLAIIVDIFAARERDTGSISASSLATEICRLSGRGKYIKEERALSYLEELDYDCLVLMGAGSLDIIKRQILENE